LFYQESLFTGDSERYVCKRTLWKRAALSKGPRGGNFKGLILAGTFIDRWRILETERLFLWEVCEGNLEGGLIYWES
jgi:hypothetical protein